MCPPGVDQTCRTSQRWTVLAPQLKERLSLHAGPERYQATPQKFLARHLTFGAFTKLARLTSPPGQLHCIDALAAVTAKGRLSALETLPAELLATIFDDDQLTPQDVIALGMSSSTLWAHAASHIKQDVRRNAAPWANTPLLCSGTWLTELPPAIYELDPKEVKHQEMYESRSGRWYGPCPARTWNYSALSAATDVAKQDIRSTWLAAFDAQAAAGTPSKSLRKYLEAIIDPPRMSQHSTWTLRNLTAKECVQLQVDGLTASAIRDGINLHVVGAAWLSLDMALLLKICWGGWRDGGDELARGGWAGHCFDVVPIEEGLPEGYADVTQMILELGKTRGLDADLDSSENEGGW